MAIDRITREMMDGKKDAIIEGFTSSSIVDNFNAIIYAVKHRMRDKAITLQLQRLSRDDTCLFGQNGGYRICEVATAALHVLEIEKYNGTEEYVLSLIESKLDIY